METPKIKSVEEVARKLQLHLGVNLDLLSDIEMTLTQDRVSLHTSLVAAVEGKRKQPWSDVDEVDYNAALDDTLTIINSIFKE